MSKRTMAYLVITLGAVVLIISLAADSLGMGERTRDRLEAADGRRCRANRDDLRGLAGLAQSEVVVIFNTIV